MESTESINPSCGEPLGEKDSTPSVVLKEKKSGNRGFSSSKQTENKNTKIKNKNKRENKKGTEKSGVKPSKEPSATVASRVSHRQIIHTKSSATTSKGFSMVAVHIICYAAHTFCLTRFASPRIEIANRRTCPQISPQNTPWAGADFGG